MTTPAFLVYDDPSNPRRPALADLGGGAKAEDAGAPADPVNDITANDANQWQQIMQRLCGVCPVASVSVHLTGTTPSIVGVVAMPTGANAPTPGTLASAFGVARSAAGVYAVTWSLGFLPTPVLPPRVRAVHDGASDALTRGAQCAAVTGGANVQTFRIDTGAFADCDFVLDIF